MKGLLLKDFYMLKKYCRTYLILIPVFWIAAPFVEGKFFTLYPCLLLGILPITLQNYDEKEKWSIYSQTLPYSSKQLVSEKYILNLLVVLLNLTIVLIGQFIQTWVLHDSGSSPEQLGVTLFITILISVFPTMLLLPMIFKFGSEKTMLCYVIVAAAIGAACGILFNTGDALPFPEITIHPAALIGTILTGVVILYGISWIISINIYSRKEFA